MSLRLKLLIVALSTLVLPWMGWQLVRQTESLLRQGQEQALQASAEAIVKAIDALGVAVRSKVGLSGVRGVRADPRRRLPGDWAWLANLQPVGPGEQSRARRAGRGPAGLALRARRGARRRAPASMRVTGAWTSDPILLELGAAASARYALASAAPGDSVHRPDPPLRELPEHIVSASGGWVLVPHPDYGCRAVPAGPGSRSPCTTWPVRSVPISARRTATTRTLRARWLALAPNACVQPGDTRKAEQCRRQRHLADADEAEPDDGAGSTLIYGMIAGMTSTRTSTAFQRTARPAWRDRGSRVSRHRAWAGAPASVAPCSPHARARAQLQAREEGRATSG